MATRFDYFGYTYEIVDSEKKEVALIKATSAPARCVVPKKVEYNNEMYTVVKIYGEYGYRTFAGEHSYYSNRTNSTVKTVVLYPTIRTIGAYSFENCSALEEINMSENVAEIGDSAFYCCSALKSIDLPEPLTLIGTSAFNGCSSLTSVTIPNSVTEIRNYAFIGCSSLTSVTVPNSVTVIGNGAFKNCENLSSIVLSNNLKSIPAEAFNNCKKLQSVTIPSSVEKIDDKAFGSIENLKVEICNEEGDVLIHPYAFHPTAEIKYVGKKAKAEKKAEKKAAKKAEKKAENEAENKAESAPQTIPAPTIDLDKLIEAVVADGVITDKERSVILKKAKAAGYDVDEVEILLDGKLAEKKNECQSVPETETKVESKLTPKAGENEADIAVGEVDTDAMWADVVAQLDVVKNSITCPKGRPYISFASKTHKKNISYWAGYSPRGEYAWVCIETYGGEAARDAIMSIVKSAPEGHICTAAEMKQGARNKEKWALTVTTSIDKPTSELVEWYVENLLAYYKFFEDAKPF